MGRTAAAALLAGGLLVLLPGTALAHASFDVRQLPAGSTQDLVLRVPLERDAANDLVEVRVPGAFTVTACPAAVGWSCDTATTATGDTVLTLARGPDGAGDTERFALTVTAPATPGDYVLPTVQTYDDGVEAAWIGEPGADLPAPRIQVADATTTVAPGDEATPHTPDATAKPTTPAPPSPGPAAAGTTPSPTPQVTPGDAAASEPQPTDDGPPPALVVIGGLVAIGAVAGAVARYRSVRP